MPRETLYDSHGYILEDPITGQIALPHECLVCLKALRRDGRSGRPCEKFCSPDCRKKYYVLKGRKSNVNALKVDPESPFLVDPAAVRMSGLTTAERPCPPMFAGAKALDA